MLTTLTTAPRRVSRSRFMHIALGGAGAAIGLVYSGIILRYLYPSAGGSTPPLQVKIDPIGITDPQTGAHLAFANGIAGPIYYPTTADRSVVVGVFVGKQDAAGPLSTENVRVIEETCTHLGCPVAWVPGDNRFECPCHGSQFNRDRSVYRGPAQQPLWAHRFALSGDAITILERQ
jgi:cytochrome b6-f complex iron-sulfur subunit